MRLAYHWPLAPCHDSPSLSLPLPPAMPYHTQLEPYHIHGAVTVSISETDEPDSTCSSHLRALTGTCRYITSQEFCFTWYWDCADGGGWFLWCVVSNCILRRRTSRRFGDESAMVRSAGNVILRKSCPPGGTTGVAAADKGLVAPYSGRVSTSWRISLKPERNIDIVTGWRLFPTISIDQFQCISAGNYRRSN